MFARHCVNKIPETKRPYELVPALARASISFVKLNPGCSRWSLIFRTVVLCSETRPTARPLYNFVLCRGRDFGTYFGGLRPLWPTLFSVVFSFWAMLRVVVLIGHEERPRQFSDFHTWTWQRKKLSCAFVSLSMKNPLDVHILLHLFPNFSQTGPKIGLNHWQATSWFYYCTSNIVRWTL